jgi:hypothetical protein
VHFMVRLGADKGAAIVLSGRAEAPPLHVCRVSEGLESSVPGCVEAWFSSF